MKPVAAARIVSLCLIAVAAGGCASGGGGTSTASKSNISTATRGYYKIGEPYEVDGVTYTPAEDWNYDETGIASWYGPGFHKKLTANGEIYDMNEVTAAHKTLPMPSLVRVTNLDNGRSIVVRVNDRGPFALGRVLDLSRRGAQLLGFEKVGTAKVRVQILAAESQQLAMAAREGKLAADLPGYDAKSPPPALPTNLPAYANAAPPPATPAHPLTIDQLLAADTTPAPQPQPPKAQPAPQALAMAQTSNPAALAPPPQDIEGKVKAGHFLPAPQVTQQAVRPANIYIQAGSFSVEQNAERLQARLNTVAKTDIAPTGMNGRPFYRVRIGPIASVDEADAILARVVAIGASDAKIVVD